MSREIRRAGMEDLNDLTDIYSRARAFMAANGNPTQWGNTTPSIEMIMADIDSAGYVVVEDGVITGAFYFMTDAHEPAYDSIEGAWLNDKPYAVVHRCAVRESSKGVGQFIMDWCFNLSGNIRIDTHKRNTPMKNLLGKNGFVYCGTVMYDKIDGERVAYQRYSGM